MLLPFNMSTLSVSMIAFLHKLGGASAIKSKLSIAFGLHKFC